MNQHLISFAAKAAVVLTLLAGLSSCGGGSSATPPPAQSGGMGGDTPAAADPGPSGTSFTSFMGRDKLMIGAMMADSTAASAPFDARYLYLTAKAPLPACRKACTEGCGEWWGCWAGPTMPPGAYAAWHLRQAAAASWQNASRPQVPVFTYYSFLPSSGGVEGAAEVAQLNNAEIVGRYLDDWRFLLQMIGSERAMLHVEPDLWGFVRSANKNPQAVPAAVASANPTDCAAHENSAAGFARCMISMVRKYAPNATVGLHASPWNYLMSGDAETTADYMLALGAAHGDFIVTDPSDRDAGWYSAQGQDRWWNDQKAAAYLAWSKALSERVGRPTVMWQIPLGNSAQNNTTNHWQDNRVDYLFAHANDVAASHIVALLFGAGHHEQTSPESDGGNLVNRTTDHWQAGGTPLR